jgi:hypothetical protein
LGFVGSGVFGIGKARGTVTQSSQREEDRGHREKKERRKEE